MPLSAVLAWASWAALAGVASSFECMSNMRVGTVSGAVEKGIAVDDATLRWCTSQIPDHWPNAQESMTSIRLFKAWDPMWEDWGRMYAWLNLDEWLRKNNATVMIGTQITCSEANDTKAWTWTKELMQIIGPDHIMGLAIGNELDLLQFQDKLDSTITPACLRRMWDDGDYWRRFQLMVADFDAMGFAQVPVTGVFTGLSLSGSPFYEVPGKARVNSFLRNATTAYGNRFAFTLNLYPYFDPNIWPDPGTADQCQRALGYSACWEEHCIVPSMIRATRLKMQQLTQRADSVLWIGETGWSAPQSGSLTTRMKGCEEWSSMATFQHFYQGFLSWDLRVGSGYLPPDHIFFFTMRDSVTFGQGEHFGLIEACDSPSCKLAYAGYEPVRYVPHPTLQPGSLYCGGESLYDGRSFWPEHCKSKCSVTPGCKFYMTWEGSGWCRLTTACAWTVGTRDQTIHIFQKQVPLPVTDTTTTSRTVTRTVTTTRTLTRTTTVTATSTSTVSSTKTSTSTTATVSSTTETATEAGTGSTTAAAAASSTATVTATATPTSTATAPPTATSSTETVTSTSTATETTSSTATTTEGPLAILSGDTVFLWAHTGKAITVQGFSVHAQWEHKGSWEALVIQKKAPWTCHPYEGDQTSQWCTSVAVQGRYEYRFFGPGSTCDGCECCKRLVGAAAGGIEKGDSILLRTHRGKYITVQNGTVHARWNHQGSWETLLIDKEGPDTTIRTGDKIFLKAHTGKYIAVEGALVQAYWDQRSALQDLTIEREA